MRLLISTRREDGNVDDICAPDEDILVYPIPCFHGDRVANKICECRETFGSLGSGRSALVMTVDRPDLNKRALREVVRRCLDVVYQDGAIADEFTAGLVGAIIKLGKVTADLPPGTVVRRQDDDLLASVDVEVEIYAPADDPEDEALRSYRPVREHLRARG
jgi:hypothetical protein